MIARARARIAALAEMRAAEMADALASTAAEQLPRGVRAERTEEGIALIGQGLVRRIGFDARLRDFGRWGR